MSYIATKSRPRYSKNDLKAEFAGDNPDYFDVENNKWYSTSGGVSIGSALTIGSEIPARNYLNTKIQADHNTQSVVAIDEPKVEYKDVIKANKMYANGEELGLQLGVGQTWQNVKASRASGVTYTNTTGKPIMVNISMDTYASYQNISVDGLSISNGENMGGGNPVFIVPNNSTYSLVSTNTGTVHTWSELR